MLLSVSRLDTWRNIKEDEHKPPCPHSTQSLPGLIPQKAETRDLWRPDESRPTYRSRDHMCLIISALNALRRIRMCTHGTWVFLTVSPRLHGVLWLTLRRTFFLGRPSSGFHTSPWTSWGSLGFSSVWSLCQQPPIFFSLIYFLILAKIWLAPHSKKNRKTHIFLRIG